MLFTDFAHRCADTIKGKNSTSVFVRTLFEAMLQSKDIKLLDGIPDNTFKSYYNNSTGISGIAKKIYKHASVESFKDFLNQHEKKALCKSFSDGLPNINEENASELIANLFYEIIEDAATQKRVANNSEYLSHISDKYSKIKTFIYQSEPQPFYDFYVCNDLIHTDRIYDATPDKINQYSIIDASAGMGKSMMMRHFLLSSKTKIPFFILLKDYNGGGLFDYIFDGINHFTREQFDALAKKGKCLFLLDGLDELKHQDEFENALDKFIDLYPRNQYIISSRPFKDFIAFNRFSVFHLAPFSDEQSLELIRKLRFRPDEPAIKQKFIKELEANLFKTHPDFTSNPLLLTIMLMTFEHFAEIPSKMHIFYGEAYDVLSQRHDANKSAFKRILKTGLAKDIFKEHFARFCAHSYVNDKYEMTKEEAKEYINGINASDFLYDLCANMCLLYFEGGKYRFTHRSFQEYFAALFFQNKKIKILKI